MLLPKKSIKSFLTFDCCWNIKDMSSGSSGLIATRNEFCAKHWHPDIDYALIKIWCNSITVVISAIATFFFNQSSNLQLTLLYCRCFACIEQESIQLLHFYRSLLSCNPVVIVQFYLGFVRYVSQGPGEYSHMKTSPLSLPIKYYFDEFILFLLMYT